MAGTALETTANKFLVDPAYQKVFKHTFDVFEDYVCGFLVAIGAIALSVRFLTSLGTGDAVCLIVGVEHVNGSLLAHSDISPIPSGGTLGLISYANYHHTCVESCLTKFLQYAPFILIIEAMLIIMTEKLFLRLPRVAGKIERFYTNIVEESLFGKDPDVAEDVCDDKANTEAIARRRRRNEVCMSLKRSSIIHQVYIFKNILEIIILLIFIPLNIYWAIDGEKNKAPGHCKVSLMEMPELGYGNGTVHFQCEGKKVHFFLILVYISTVFQICCVICSGGSLIWCFFFRSISRLLRSLSKDDDLVGTLLEIDEEVGEDFLFLFDLLSHTSGIESTMRVLTHSDDTFRRICLPKIKNDGEHIKVEEDKLKVIWNAALVEKWLVSNEHREIKVNSYDVTIFPAESSKNSVTKKAKLTTNSMDKDADKYSAWFFDLAGGKTEYIVTIACVIGKSRMKGARVVTNLLPYGAEKPRGGILKTAGTKEVEIAWEPPKGDFTKYVLTVDANIGKPKHLAPPVGGHVMPPLPHIPMYISQASNNGSATNIGSFGDLSEREGMTRRDISSKVTNFMIHGLGPGEIYSVQLLTKTGDKETRQPIKEVVLTKAEKVSSLNVTEIGTDCALVKWLAPEGHSRLKAFNITWTTKDGKEYQEFAVKNNSESLVNTFRMENIPSATEFTISITTVCVFEKMKTLSDSESVEFVTLPVPPRNLEMESRLTNSFQVKWDCSSDTAVTSHKYRLAINCDAINYSNTYEINGDRRTFNFSKLPDITGTGVLYTVRIIYVVQPIGSDKEVESEALTGNFLTRPLPPSNFSIGEEENQISFHKSPTPSINYYKLRYKSSEEGSKPEEYLINNNENKEEENINFTFPQKLMSGIQYRVNIYAVVDRSSEDIEILESKELHEKIIQTSTGLQIYIEEPEANE